jgi:hypothetical protein
VGTFRAASRKDIKPIVCPACGSIGYPSDDELFEIRGQLEGKPVRRCVRCGTGLFIRPLRKPRVIPHNLWVRMQESWQAEFNAPVSSPKEECPELQMARSLLELADGSETDPETRATYLLEAAPRLMTYYCTQEGMTPWEAFTATADHLQDVGWSFELTTLICRRVGVPIDEYGRLPDAEQRRRDPTAFDLSELGWTHIRDILLEQWSRCDRADMTHAECFSQTIIGCGDDLSYFSSESAIMLFRLAGLPIYEIADSIRESADAKVAGEVIRCRCGCGEAVQPPNKAYVNKSHQSLHMQAS